MIKKTDAKQVVNPGKKLDLSVQIVKQPAIKTGVRAGGSRDPKAAQPD